MAHPQKRILDGYTDYWKQSTYAEKLHLRVFTQADTLGHYLRLKPGIHVLVAAPELLRTLSSSDVRGIIVIAFSEEKSEQLAGADFPCRIENPYQPIPQLFQSIIEYCESENASEGIKRSDTACRIVGITSTSGGAGKSTTAFHLSAAAAQSGLRPFLLNVDPIQEYSLLLQEPVERNEEQSNLAQLFYYLRKAEGGQGNEPMPLEPFMLSIPAIGARMLHPKQLAEEWKWMDASMTRLLLNTLRSSGQYDLIIVEGEYFHSPFEAVWDVADQVMWLLLDDMAYIQKTKLLLQQWEIAEESVVRQRSKLIRMGVNRYMGTMLNSWQQRDVPISGYLPYIPAWKQIYRFDQWLQSSVFRSTLEEWAGAELGLFSGAR